MTSARPFRFGIQTGPFDRPAELRDFAGHVEGLGYAELFSYDHIGMVDPFLPLLVAAEATSTLRFGPLVLNNEFHNPVLVARAAATFDLLTGGRLLLGLGTGYMRAEHDAADIELRPPAARVTRFEESVTALRSLLDTGGADVHGEEIRIDVADLGVRPAAAHVPFLIGGHGPRVVRLAGQHADVFQFTGLTHASGSGAPGAGGFDAGQLRERRVWLEAAAGARIDRIDISALVQMTVVDTSDRNTAVDAARAAERIGISPDVLDDIPFVLIGTVDQIVEKLLRLREELGIHHYVVRDPVGFAPVVDRLAGT